MRSMRRPTSYFVDARGPRVARLGMLAAVAALALATAMMSGSTATAGSTTDTIDAVPPESQEESAAPTRSEPLAHHGFLRGSHAI
jgi:hypothetical protein